MTRVKTSFFGILLLTMVLVGVAIAASFYRSQHATEQEAQLAQLVERYNTLVDQWRFTEAEAIAKEMTRVDPTSELARHLVAQCQIIREAHPECFPGEKEGTHNHR
jgi:hypothetical protein